jgi:hypothetical protein
VSKNILQSISELEGINVTETELDMCVNNQFRKSENFTTKMKGVPKTRLFALFGRKGSEEN